MRGAKAAWLNRAPHTILVVLLSMGLEQVARAGTINLVDSFHLATGTDCSGNVITGGGQADCHWFVDDYFGPGPAYTVFPGNGDYYGDWVANDQQGDWVAFDPNNLDHNATATFIRTFDLTGQNLADVYMQGLWTIDDVGYLALNGNLIDSLSGAPRTSLHSFFVPAGSPFFQPGINVLTITITWTDVFYEGARLESGVAPPPPPPPPPPGQVPEPSALGLLGTGLTAIGVVVRRRRQRAVK